jgi:hypothetical protein
MRTIYAGLVLCLFAYTSCNSTSKAGGEAETSTTTQSVTHEPVQSKLNEEGTKHLISTLASYYQLKDALVGTNADKAKVAAADLAIKADSMKSFAVRAGGNDSLVAYMDTVIAQSRNITGMDDKTCEKQRIAFEPISNAVYIAIKKSELKNAGVYHQYCPMAFNDKGAYWLSDISDIKNPYFGKKMLECGEVTDSL